MRPDRTIVGPRAGIRWFLAGYAGVAGFLLLEATVRQPGSASDLHASKEDAGSTRGIEFEVQRGMRSICKMRSGPFLRKG